MGRLVMFSIGSICLGLVAAVGLAVYTAAHPLRGRADRGVYGGKREQAWPACARPLRVGCRTRGARATPGDPRVSGGCAEPCLLLPSDPPILAFRAL